MAQKTKIADLVQIAPEDFYKNSIDAIEDNINSKYASKVNTTFPFLLSAFSYAKIPGYPEDRPLR